MSNLVIVESPTKAGTIKSYLGSGYRVVASKGHVRDLPKSTLGVDIENGFKARYINIRGKGELIAELKKESKNADKVFLATDPDREGEAISWHLAVALGIPDDAVCRVTFNEVTKNAVKAAIKKPRKIDADLVNSQQARRIVDRIVGYKLSPFLWKSVRGGLSAGRVQSVATRIIVERENEIQAFIPTEYWNVEALLNTPDGNFTAKYYGDEKEKKELRSKSEADAVLAAAEKHPFIVNSVKRSTRYKNPQPPFTTSTMQQEAAKKLGFQSQKIMKVAQELYEGVNIGAENGGTQGLITYMRTDSLRISEEAQKKALEYIKGKFGENYLPSGPRVYKSKASAQDAHEAIRPANPALEPEKIKKYLTADQYKLFVLIRNRFIASQMASAELDTVSIELRCSDNIFRSSGYTVKFPGYFAVNGESDVNDGGDATEGIDRVVLPDVKKDDKLNPENVKGTRHFTEPPARYTEASLIKFLEEKGIGRPSTYTPIITTIISRGYVERDGRSLKPTVLGSVTTKLMIDNFPEIVDYAFTAQMEGNLDNIEHGNTDMNAVLSSFYEGFEKQLLTAEKNISRESVEIPAEQTDIICDKCGARMIVKNGRFGKFAACPNYPECKFTKPLARDGKSEKQKEETVLSGMKCDKCGHDMVLRSGRYGSFYACSNYPSCKNTKQIVHSIGVKCPKCGKDVVSKRGKNRSFFYSCENYPECDFSSWDAPIGENCPDCGEMLYKKKGKRLIVCLNKDCGYKREIKEHEKSDD